MLKTCCMFISLAANVLLLVLLLTTSPIASAPAIGDLIDDAAAQSCEGAMHVKEYDPQKHGDTYVAQVDPEKGAKLPGRVMSYRLLVQCSGH